MKTIFKGKINNIDILIRYPAPSDAKQMTDYINSLSDERSFIRMQGEHKTLEEEKQFLRSKIIEIKNQKAIMLLVIAENKLIGISDISLNNLIERHIGTFGISLIKEYRGKGLGKFLMNLTEEEGKSRLKGLEIIRLGVFSNNVKAITMYKKFGYKIEGRLPNGVKLENGYVDHIFMYKVVI